MIAACFFYLQKYLLRFVHFCLFPFRTGQPHCVVLNRTDHLGDVLCSLPSMVEFCRYFHGQGYRVVLLTEPAFRWFVEQRVPFDRIIPVRRLKTYESLWYRYALFLKLYLLRTEKWISYIECDATGYITAWSCAKEIHQLQTMLPRNPFFLRLDACVTHRHPCNPEESVFRQYEDFAVQITGNPFHSKIPDLRDLVPAELAVSVLNGPYYVIFPGASAIRNCWPPERFAEVIQRIHGHAPALLSVLAGSSGDLPLCEAVLAALPANVRCLSLCGETSLPGLFQLIANARFVLGNDSGGIHLAAMLRVPSFAVLHGGSFKQFLPNPYYRRTVCVYHRMPCFRCNSMCVAEDATPPCLLAVSADRVAAPVLAFLNRGFVQRRRARRTS